MAEQFFLARDVAGDWFVVPAKNRAAWYEWLNGSSIPIELRTDPPFGAKKVSGPSEVEFSNPRVRLYGDPRMQIGPTAPL